jgi:hypothetical protein
MRWRIELVLCSLIVGLTALGCGTTPSKEEMGTIVKDIPKVEGADKPYEMPQLVKPTPEEDDPLLNHR